MLDENVQREYKFSINPSLVNDQPIILIMPDSSVDDYWRTLIESVAGLNQDTATIIEEDAPRDSMNDTLKDTICGMSRIMNHIVNSDSWKNNELSEEDKEKINSLLSLLKLD